MDETILFPSPNWFQPSGLAVSTDGWLVYGGPSKSLCVLEPLPADFDTVVQGNQGYTAHVVNRAHPEKIVCVDICPEWPEKRAVLTGSADGSVKQWSLEHSSRTLQMKSTHSHEIHSHEKEEVVGVGYCDNGYAVTVGGYSNIVKWDLNSNVAKSFNHVLKNFKAVCMACSPHMHMNVAIGTKQGVVFVLDLNGAPRVVYKVRGQDDEIIKVSWCPQYEVAVRKALKESDKNRPTSAATARLEKIRHETASPNTLKELDERVQNSHTTEQPVLINEKFEPVKELPKQDTLDESGIGKTLPEDSFDESVVQEDDMFDIYTDHAAEEFGHKKFQPVDVMVKVDEEAPKVDYLTECQKLKEEILKRKTLAEAPIADLVEALDRTHVEIKTPEVKVKEGETSDVKAVESNGVEVKTADVKEDINAPEVNVTEVKATEVNYPEADTMEAKNMDVNDPEVEVLDVKSDLQVGPSKCDMPSPVEGKITKGEVESSVHIHKHLLATIGKHGSIRVWSKSGKLVGSCAVLSGAPGKNQNQRGRNAPGGCTTLLWHQPDVLLIADGKSQLINCNPLKIDCRNKLEWHVQHTHHKRGLCAVASAAPRRQPPGTPPGDWRVWTTAQDRNLIAYSLKTGGAESRATCGGFVYCASPCPYDASKIALSVGDGAVRVWESESLEEEDKLSLGRVTGYWQNVQGKVLTHAWHPTRENLLAFATAESRVGLLDTSGKCERPARVLQPAGSGGVYSLHWGEGGALYAAGGGQALLYDCSAVDRAPTPVSVEWQGQQWAVSVARWAPRGLLVGSTAGAVAVLTPDIPHRVLAAAFVYSKMIHTIEWHPQHTSEGELSPLRDLIAVCSLDKVNTVAILQYSEEDGGTQLCVSLTLSGHRGTVLQLAWSPHRDHQLLSTSQDATVRVWDVTTGMCTAIFGGHTQSALCATWSAHPSLSDRILSGGGDCCVRLWDLRQHAPELYEETKHETAVDKKKKKREKKEKKEKADDESSLDAEENAAAILESKIKSSRKFLLPMTFKQIHPCLIKGPRRMLQKYLAGDVKTEEGEEYGIDYIKMFGNINEVNELLDCEMERHLDTGNTEAWALLCTLRGHIDTLISHAAAHSLLDPFLLTLAPSVSFKYWKDATLLYLQQIDRLIAKGEEAKLNESRPYGGAVLRKTAALLSLHDVLGAVSALTEARLFQEAYVLSRTRYMDSLAEHTLRLWAQDCVVCGSLNMAAVCYIALEDLSQAAAILGRSTDEESLCLAADIAKVLGQTTFAGHIEEKRELIKNKKEAEKEEAEELKELPSRVEVIISCDTDQVKDSMEESKEDGSKENSDEKETNEEKGIKNTNDKLGTSKEANGTDEVGEKPVPSNNVEDDTKTPEKNNVVEVVQKSDRSDKKDTEELLADLPQRMESLMKESNSTATQRGDGDFIPNNETKDQTNNNVIVTAVLENCQTAEKHSTEAE